MKARLILLALSAGVAGAASSAAWEMTAYQDFLKGRFTGLSLSRDGKLQLAPRIETIFSSGQQAIWTLAQSADGTLYAGTGHRGRVFRIDRSGRGENIWTAEQPEVFAVAVDARGVPYAASSPNGKVYKLEGGKATEFFAPESTYIWALAFDKDGALFVGVGEPGRIYRVDSTGKGEVWYETGQSHVTALAFDAQGRLLAGTEPNGIIYRVTAKGKAFVLYDAALPEIRTLLPAADGSLYAIAMGGSMMRGGGGAGGAATPSLPGSIPSISVTVTGEAAQSGVEIKPKPEAPKPSASGVAAPAQPAPSTIELSDVEKSAIYRIRPDNTVETLWSSKEENAYDAQLSGDRLLIATDGQGRLYRFESDRKVTLVTQTNEAEVLRLLPSSSGMLAATGNPGKLIRLGAGAGDTGAYESPVHDAGNVARWGRLSWMSRSCAQCSLTFHTRSGNSARPDDTWSEWSAPLSSTDAAIPSPNARFAQWKAEFRGAAGAGPVLDSVRLSYLPQNQPPVLKSITVTAQSVAVGVGQTTAATPAYSITVTDTGEVSSGSTGTPSQPVTRASSEQFVISWAADDPDHDRLSYSLAFRPEGDSQWIEMKSNLSEASYTIDGQSLADGRYFFRVVASDGASNSAGSAREAELVSAPILVDHTPPVVTLGTPSGGEISWEAADALSPLKSCEYSIDAGPWTGVDAEDGVVDSARERFRLRLPAVGHLLVVRVTDLAGNSGLARVRLTAPAR